MHVQQQVLESSDLELLLLGTAELVHIAIGEEVHHIAWLALDVLTLEDNRLDLSIETHVGTNGVSLTRIDQHLVVSD